MLHDRSSVFQSEELQEAAVLDDALPPGLLLAGYCPPSERRELPKLAEPPTRPQLEHRNYGHLHVDRYLGGGRWAVTCHAPGVKGGPCARTYELTTSEVQTSPGHCGCRGNRRYETTSHLVTYRGRSKSIAAWARTMTSRGVPMTTECLRKRLATWDLEKAMTTPMRQPPEAP